MCFSPTSWPSADIINHLPDTFSLSLHTALESSSTQETTTPLARVDIQGKELLGNSLAVQWLGLSAFTAKDLGSIPGWETKILQAVQHSLGKKSQRTIS